jgi:hypothetical protein
MNDAAERVFKQVRREQEVRTASMTILRRHAPKSAALRRAVTAMDSAIALSCSDAQMDDHIERCKEKLGVVWAKEARRAVPKDPASPRRVAGEA